MESPAEIPLEVITREDDKSNPPSTHSEHNIDSNEPDRSLDDCEGNEIQAKGFDFGSPRKVDKLTKLNQFICWEEVALSIMDVALFVANISQLKTMLKAGSENVEFYYFLLVCVTLSLAGQVTFACMIIPVAILKRANRQANADTESPTAANNLETDGKTVSKDKSVNVLNCVSMFLVLTVTVINVCISCFGIEIKDDIRYQ